MGAREQGGGHSPPPWMDLEPPERDRRDGDRLLHRRLAAKGFSGPEYDLFQAELTRYAFVVLRSWLRRGVIFDQVARLGRAVSCADDDRARLAESLDDRVELALETIAEALVAFRAEAMVGGRWTPEGSASLRTYFIGACLLSFPNVFRRWSRERQNWADVELTEDEKRIHTGIAADPAEVAVGNQSVLDALLAIPPETRELVARVVINGESYLEAGKAVGLGERAVEGRIRRLRKEAQRRQGERGGS